MERPAQVLQREISKGGGGTPAAYRGPTSRRLGESSANLQRVGRRRGQQETV